MKNLRLKFRSGEQKNFIESVYSKSGLSTRQLAQIANIHPRSFIDWRKEKLTMTSSAAETFYKKFGLILPEQKKTLIERWRKTQKEANKIGGISCFKKYGSPATLEGMRRGGLKTIAILRARGIVSQPKKYTLPSHNKELAEFVGILLGDGYINKNYCSITLNSIADKEYVGFVNALGKNLFGETPKSFKRKTENTYILLYNGNYLIKYFTTLGLKIGNKVKQQVGVPKWIVENIDYSIACMRGLMDTDGGVFLHKYKVNGKGYSYKKICFTNRSIPLLYFMEQKLKQIGLTPGTIYKVDNKKVWLYNSSEVNEYLEIVGTHNSRLLKYQ